MFFIDNNFKIISLFIFLAELLSIFGFILPEYNQIAFLVIVTLTFIISLYKLEYGLLILLTELFIGSKGYLFSLNIAGLNLSIRIAFWLIVMSVWSAKIIAKMAADKKISFKIFAIPYQKYYWLLFLTIIFGLINGLLNKNEYSNIFFDFNGWLYFSIIFPLAYAISRQGEEKKFSSQIINLFIICSIWISVKTLAIAFIFSHNITGIIYELYQWLRLTGIGEITQMQGGFYRVFFQAHIFTLISFFIFLVFLINNQSHINKKIYWLNFFLCSVFLSTNILAFSRSNWIGLLLGLFVIAGTYVFIKNYKKFAFTFVNFLLLFITGFILIITITKFPYPKPTGGFNTTDLLARRVSELTEESGVASRWALLNPLLDKIKSSPILGEGFGTTVTYKSSDPRILEKNPQGFYSTYAFEWGWLDIWLKLGIFGLLSYLLLLYIIISKNIKKFLEFKYNRDSILYSLLIGLIAITAISFFSPYMNHPLGIGYLIIVSLII